MSHTSRAHEWCISCGQGRRFYAGVDIGPSNEICQSCELARQRREFASAHRNHEFFLLATVAAVATVAAAVCMAGALLSRM